MDHVALNRAGPYNGDLDDKVVKCLGLKTRQHVDLRAAFDLKGADAVALLQHRIDRRIFGRNAVQAIIPAACLPQHFEAFADAGQHTQCQYIDLQQVQRVDIVLVPFNEGPVRHGAIVDRHGFIKPVFGQDITADMLRQMARKIEQLSNKGMQPGDVRVVGVKPRLNQPRLGQVPAKAAPYRSRQTRGDIFGQANGFTNFAHGAARAIVDDRGGNARAVPLKPAIDILHHLFAPLMFEIDVDIGWLIALFG